MINKRLIALSLACTTAASLVSCKDENKKTVKIEDVAAAASKVMDKNYKGIISSDIKHCFNDRQSLYYRKTITDSTPFDGEWLIIADGKKVNLYSADKWDAAAKGYKNAENEDELTLEEIYKKNLEKLKKENENDDEDEDDYKEGLITSNKKETYDKYARRLANTVENALYDAYYEGYSTKNIGYIVFEKGKITDINCAYLGADELADFIEEYTAEHFDEITKISSGVVFCSYGDVSMALVSDGMNKKIEGAYPVTFGVVGPDVYRGRIFSEVLDELKDEYDVTAGSGGSGGGISGGSANTELGSVKLKTGGDEFVIVVPTEDNYRDLVDYWCEYAGIPKDKVRLQVLDAGWSQAPEYYDQIFAAGTDMDMYIVEADWSQRYLSNPTKAAPLSDLGFSEDNFINSYGYALEVGRALEGENKGKLTAAAWNAAPGGFAYRTDLAEKYLGVHTPEEMQAMISDWDKFAESARKIYSSSGINLADSLGGMFYAYSYGKPYSWYMNGKPQFDDSVEHFANIAKNLWDNGGLSHASQWSNEWTVYGSEGTTMGYFVTTWAMNKYSFFGIASENSRGLWNVVQGPSPYFWGGDWLVVNPNTDNADLAQSFIYTTCVDSDAMFGIAYCYDEFVNNKEVMESLKTCVPDNSREILGGQSYYEALHKNALATDIKGKITPYDASIKSIVLDTLKTEYLENGWSYKQLLGIIANECENYFP